MTKPTSLVSAAVSSAVGSMPDKSSSFSSWSSTSASTASQGTRDDTSNSSLLLRGGSAGSNRIRGRSGKPMFRRNIHREERHLFRNSPHCISWGVPFCRIFLLVVLFIAWINIALFHDRTVAHGDSVHDHDYHHHHMDSSIVHENIRNIMKHNNDNNNNQHQVITDGTLRRGAKHHNPSSYRLAITSNHHVHDVSLRHQKREVQMKDSLFHKNTTTFEVMANNTRKEE